MFRGRRLPILNLLLLLSFLTAGISPVCKFVSGQTSLIEICTSTGLESVEVPADNQEDHEHEMAEQCLFCFASHTGKAIAAANILPPAIKAQISQNSDRAPAFVAFVIPAQYEARAPPSLS